MKKAAACIVCAICTLFAITASATGSVELLLAGDNARIAGVLDPGEFQSFDEVEAAHAAIPGGLGATGCVLRDKSVLSADAKALSKVDVDDFEIVNIDLLEQVGYSDSANVTPAGLVADTVECDGARQSHKMLGMSKVSSKTLAAEIEIDGRLLYVLVYDWDGDGDNDVCLVAGSSSDMGYRRGSKATSGGSTGGTTNESTGSSEPDPHYRDWESDSGTTSSSGTPDPHYRNF